MAVSRAPAGIDPALAHRPYFRAGIGIILTLGALWGVILLLRIGFMGSFTSVGIHEVNAHGHAQIFGWVGLFVMGFASRMLPALTGVPLPRPRMIKPTLILMLTGIVLRSALQPFVTAMPAVIPVALLVNLLEIAAIGIFLGQMLRLLAGSFQPSNGAGLYIRAALFFFLAQAIAGTLYFAATAWATDREALLWYVSHLQAPLRDLQIHGFAMMMVLGVTLWVVPRWFGTRPVARRPAMIAATLLILSVLGEVAGFLLMRTVGYRWAALWGFSTLTMLATVAWLTWRTGILAGHPMGDRSSKFLRAAYGWLLLSLVMLVVLPGWQFGVLPRLAPASHAVEIGFSHAYYGAIRHAITVGFLSLMILGMSSRLVKELHAAPGARLTHLWIPFLLVNAGCAMRVGFQALTDISPAAFPIAGVSGILELSGIAVWAFHLLATMRARLRQ